MAGLGFHAARAASAAGQVAAFAAPPPPPITAASAYVIDATAGTELYALNPNEPRAIASLTKIATALVVLEHADLDDEVVVEGVDLADESESQVGLVADDTLSVEDLLYGLLVPSGNDAARALARFVGGRLGADGSAPVAAFVAEMNALAARLGLEQTRFTNPAGLDDPEHVSTARDLARLTSQAMNDPTFASIVASTSAVLGSRLRPEGYAVATTNALLLEGGVDGVKTGTTAEAGGCLIAAATVGGNRIIAVVLGSPIEVDETGLPFSTARFDDARTILAALPNDYRWFDPTEPGAIAGLAEELAVWQATLPPGPAVVVPAARSDEVRYRVQLGPPGEANAEVGKVLFFAGSDLLSERPVFQSTAVLSPGFSPSVDGEVAAAVPDLQVADAA